MKNLKHILAATTMTAILTFGASTAKAGLILSDVQTNTTQQQCVQQEQGAVQSLTGIILLGLTAARDGIILLGINGSSSTMDKQCPATSNSLTGLILSD